MIPRKAYAFDRLVASATDPTSSLGCFVAALEAKRLADQSVLDWS